MDFLDTPCISHGFESFGGPFGDHFGGLYAPTAFEAVECGHRAVRAPFRHWASRACMPLYLNSRIQEISYHHMFLDPKGTGCVVGSSWEPMKTTSAATLE